MTNPRETEPEAVLETGPDTGNREMTPAEMTAWIDGQTYEGLLRWWRFSPPGDPFFQGETGVYYGKVMVQRREQEPDGGVAASKQVALEADPAGRHGRMEDGELPKTVPSMPVRSPTPSDAGIDRPPPTGGGRGHNPAGRGPRPAVPLLERDRPLLRLGHPGRSHRRGVSEVAGGRGMALDEGPQRQPGRPPGNPRGMGKSSGRPGRLGTTSSRERRPGAVAGSWANGERGSQTPAHRPAGERAGPRHEGRPPRGPGERNG